MLTDTNVAANPTFTRTSDRESVCVLCSAVIKTDAYVSLDRAEDIHADICLAKKENWPLDLV